MKPEKRISFFLAFLLIFSVSSGLFASVHKDLILSLEHKRIEGFDISGLSIIFYINISNLSSSLYHLIGYSYRFTVNELEYIRLQISLENQIRIEPRKNKLISFPVKITYANLFKSIEGLEEEDEAVGNWQGHLSFSDGRKERGKLYFSFTEKFPIFRRPDVAVHSLHVNQLTIGGADLIFKANFKNSNGFEIQVERIDYKLYLGDSLVEEESIRSDIVISGKSDGAFSFPLLLNFFEVGKEVYDVLLHPSIFCRFSGEIEVKTAWGKVKIPFDKRGRVAISRTS